MKFAALHGVRPKTELYRSTARRGVRPDDVRLGSRFRVVLTM
jgi:hypothetical protein